MLDRLKGFLPEIANANRALADKQANFGREHVNIENVEGADAFIEMVVLLSIMETDGDGRILVWVCLM